MSWIAKHQVMAGGARFVPGQRIPGDALSAAQAGALLSKRAIENADGEDAPSVSAKTAPPQPGNDLTRLKGVGAATARALNAAVTSTGFRRWPPPMPRR